MHLLLWIQVDFGFPRSELFLNFNSKDAITESWFFSWDLQPQTCSTLESSQRIQTVCELEWGKKKKSVFIFTNMWQKKIWHFLACLILSKNRGSISSPYDFVSGRNDSCISKGDGNLGIQMHRYPGAFMFSMPSTSG